MSNGVHTIVDIKPDGPAFWLALHGDPSQPVQVIMDAAELSDFKLFLKALERNRIRPYVTSAPATEKYTPVQLPELKASWEQWEERIKNMVPPPADDANDADA